MIPSTHNAAKVLGLYIVTYSRGKEHALVVSYGSEDALDHLLELGIDLDWYECTVRRVQRNIEGPRGAVWFGRGQAKKNFRQHPAPNRKPQALLAQPDRASEFYSEGCGSKSCGAHQP